MSQQKMVLQPCSGKHISPLRQPGIVDKGGAGDSWRGPLPVLSLARFPFPTTLPSPINLLNKKEAPMLYCEMFIVSHALGNCASSSVIGIVLR